MSEKEVISDFLRLCRENSSKTQAEFAAEIKMSRKQLSSLELQTANPSFATLKKIAGYGGLTLPELLRAEGDSPCLPGSGGAPEAAMARRVRSFRVKNGISQEKFAALLDISVSQLSRIERGVAVPCLDTLQALARQMEITVAQLLTPTAEEGDM